MKKVKRAPVIFSWLNPAGILVNGILLTMCGVLLNRQLDRLDNMDARMDRMQDNMSIQAQDIASIKGYLHISSTDTPKHQNICSNSNPTGEKHEPNS